MRAISLVNQKGGCGKTTTAVHLAGALAARGERVVLVDLDPQAHATLSLGCSVEGRPTVGDVLSSGVEVTAAAYRAPGGFDLVPASEGLAEFEDASAQMLGPERRLADELGRASSRYSCAVLDCPPRADGVLTANALHASDTVLLVVETGTYALQGARKAMRVLERFSQDLERSFEVRAVATLFDRRSRLAREILVGMHIRFGELLLNSVIRTSERLREAAASGLPIQLFDPGSGAARDFAELAGELCGSDPHSPRDETKTSTVSRGRGAPVLHETR